MKKLCVIILLSTLSQVTFASDLKILKWKVLSSREHVKTLIEETHLRWDNYLKLGDDYPTQKTSLINQNCYALKVAYLDAILLNSDYMLTYLPNITDEEANEALSGIKSLVSSTYTASYYCNDIGTSALAIDKAQEGIDKAADILEKIIP